VIDEAPPPRRPEVGGNLARTVRPVHDRKLLRRIRMRPIALALATTLAVGLATVGPLHAQQDVEIEVEVEEEGDLSDLGTRPRGPQAPAILYGAEGFYGIVAGTYGVEDFKNLKNDIEDDLAEAVDFDNTLGFNLRGGYRWHHHLATELEWEWLDTFDLEKTSASGGVGEVWSITANQKAFLSTGRFQLFLLFGGGLYGVADAEVAGDNEEPQGQGFGMRAGTGFNYYFTEQLGLNLDVAYNFGVGGLNELRYTSFSWGLIFNP
jgi:opacity protein-like surface antigen